MPTPFLTVHDAEGHSTLAGSPVARSRRADAERNRERILVATRALLADRSGDVSMGQVARRAGVGIATLYRNYAGLRELLEDLYAREVDELCRAAQEASGPAGEALRTWLHLFVVFHDNKHPIAVELLRHTDTMDPVFGRSRARVVEAGRPLLVAAQQAHEARTDLTIDHVLDLVLAVVTVSSDRLYVEPILRTALDGLRPWGRPGHT